MRVQSASATDLLVAWSGGDQDAFDRLVLLVHFELRQTARRLMMGERPDHTLQPTALVHEMYLRLADANRVQWRDRTHFLSTAARVMRHVLVDHARARYQQKRGGRTAQRVPLEEALAVPTCRVPAIIELDAALSALARVHERPSCVVELRYFGGLTLEEIADVLGVSRDTVKRDWQFAKLWLWRELARGSATS